MNLLNLLLQLSVGVGAAILLGTLVVTDHTPLSLAGWTWFLYPYLQGFIISLYFFASTQLVPWIQGTATRRLFKQEANLILVAMTAAPLGPLSLAGYVWQKNDLSPFFRWYGPYLIPLVQLLPIGIYLSIKLEILSLIAGSIESLYLWIFNLLQSKEAKKE